MYVKKRNFIAKALTRIRQKIIPAKKGRRAIKRRVKKVADECC